MQQDPSARPSRGHELETQLSGREPAQASSRLPSADMSPPDGAPKQQRPPLRGLLWSMLLSMLAGVAIMTLLWAQRDAAPVTPAAARPPAGTQSPTPIDLHSEEAKPWELAMVADGLQRKLADAGIPEAPDDCPTEQRLAAAMLMLTAQSQLETSPNAALEASDQSVQQCGSWAAAHGVRGDALQRLERLDEAVRAYGEALRLQPNYDLPRFNLGLVQLRRKDAAAIATFSDLIKRRPDYPDVYASRARAHLLANHLAQGLADLERAVTQDASTGAVWLMLGEVRARLKMPNAQEAFCKALELGVEDAREHCRQ